jgi:hypothetical protein
MRENEPKEEQCEIVRKTLSDSRQSGGPSEPSAEEEALSAVRRVFAEIPEGAFKIKKVN